MKNEKSKNKVIPAIIIFCIAYIILALKPLSTELHFTPEWTQDIQHVKQNPSTEAKLIPFKMGQNIGYFTENGIITSAVTFPYKAAISDSLYTTFGVNNSNTDFFNADGTKAGTISLYGFPYFSENRIYVFLPGGSSFAKCGPDGTELWRWENYCPITAFSSKECGTVTGYADGSIIALDAERNIIQEFSPGGSNRQVILGADISNDGTKIACISGHDSQRFIVAEKNSGHSKIIFHKNIKDESNFQQLVKFSSDDSKVFYSAKNEFSIVDLKKLKNSSVQIKGRILQIEESPVENLIFVLSLNEGEYTVTAIENIGKKIGQFSFKAENAFIQIYNDRLFAGRDGKISCMQISKK